MKEEVERIYHNSSRISTLDRAKRYEGDIGILYAELVAANDRISFLEEKLKNYSKDPDAAETVQQISKILIEKGYIKYQGPA